MRITIRITSRRGGNDTKQITGETRIPINQLLRTIKERINDRANKEILFESTRHCNSHDITIFPQTIMVSCKSISTSVNKHEYNSEELAEMIRQEGIIK